MSLESRQPKATTNNIHLLFVYMATQMWQELVEFHTTVWEIETTGWEIQEKRKNVETQKWQIEAEQQTENLSVFAGYEHIHQLSCILKLEIQYLQ